MSFSKLDSGITKSSLWSEPLHVRIVFVSFLAEKDEFGFVSASRTGMIRTCNVTAEQFDDAEMVLLSPDPDSKSKEYEGRRISKVEGGWIVLNHEKYRLPEQQKKEKHREYMRNWRESRSVNSREFTQDHNDSPSVSVSDSVSSIKKEVKKKDTETPLWKQKSPEGYKAYIAMAEPEFDRLMADLEWIAEQKRYYRSVRMCVIQSLEKMWFQYWGTEEGWNHCRKKRNGETINWKRTIQNGLSMKCNQVSFKYDEPDICRNPVRLSLLGIRGTNASGLSDISKAVCIPYVEIIR